MRDNLLNFRKPFPGVIRLEPAAACNLACSHCPTGTVSIKRGVMSEEIFERLLGELKSQAPLIRVVVLYHGGEPLLNRSFIRMVRAISKLGIPQIKTVSNGTLVQKENAEDLLTSGLTEIEFSIDDQSKEENDRIRRRVETESLFRNLEYFLLRRAVVNPGLKVWISSTQFIDPPRCLPSSPAPIPAYAFDRFKEFGLTEKDFKCAFAMVWPHMVVEPHFQIYVDDSGEEDANACDHVESTITIRSDGTVVPCCYDLTSQLPMGRIQEKSLQEIWNDKPYLRLRQEIDARNYPQLCRNCNVVRAKKHYLVKALIPARETQEAFL